MKKAGQYHISMNPAVHFDAYIHNALLREKNVISMLLLLYMQLLLEKKISIYYLIGYESSSR